MHLSELRMPQFKQWQCVRGRIWWYKVQWYLLEWVSVFRWYGCSFFILLSYCMWVPSNWLGIITRHLIISGNLVSVWYNVMKRLGLEKLTTCGLKDVSAIMICISASNEILREVSSIVDSLLNPIQKRSTRNRFQIKSQCKCFSNFNGNFPVVTLDQSWKESKCIEKIYMRLIWSRILFWPKCFMLYVPQSKFYFLFWNRSFYRFGMPIKATGI